jgi:hypothetical protein
LDARCFDVLIRDLARHASRRSALAGLIGAGGAALAGTAGRGDALGKKRRKRKKNRCAGNQQRCDGSCKDLLTDEANCGACGNACAALESCVQGNCACVGANRQVCSGACVDLATDTNNCGACGFVCESGECVNGACTCNGGQGQCLSGCACADRLGGGKVCFKGGNDGTTCDSDGDCPFRSLCFSINKCSIPCVA